jgi:hypothetical protein
VSDAEAPQLTERQFARLTAQSRPLDPAYAAVFLDAIVVKVRDNQVVQNQARLHRDRRRRRRREARAGHLARQDPAAGRHRRGGRPVLGMGDGRPAVMPTSRRECLAAA